MTGKLCQGALCEIQVFQISQPECTKLLVQRKQIFGRKSVGLDQLAVKRMGYTLLVLPLLEHIFFIVYQHVRHFFEEKVNC